MPKLIAIEGLDGSGKDTQSKLLFSALTEEGRSVRLLSFPDYESPSSTLVKMYLGGELGKKPGDVAEIKTPGGMISLEVLSISIA